jgi:hypothetical protein
MVLAESANLCFVIWRGAVTRATFAKQKEGLAQVVRNWPDGVVFLCIIEPTAKPPNDELRLASTQMIQEHGSRILSVAVVIEGDGFRAAITRSVISGMALLHPRRQPSSTFSSVRSALAWIQNYIPIDVVRIGGDIEKARGRLAPLQ